AGAAAARRAPPWVWALVPSTQACHPLSTESADRRHRSADQLMAARGAPSMQGHRDVRALASHDPTSEHEQRRLAPEQQEGLLQCPYDDARLRWLPWAA
ncbi:MAG: hypothetical protein JWO02_545, partial [Solirubrobacterales bacterium]|nr:hypothetical protein [Solirubrobacterales bacterium]